MPEKVRAYTDGMLVWARVQGYPWWPGVLSLDPERDVPPDELRAFPVDDQSILVLFLDTEQYAWLRPSRVKHWNCPEYRQYRVRARRNPDLWHALATARAYALKNSSAQVHILPPLPDPPRGVQIRR